MIVLYDDVGSVHDIRACSDSYSTVNRCRDASSGDIRIL